MGVVESIFASGRQDSKTHRDDEVVITESEIRNPQQLYRIETFSQ